MKFEFVIYFLFWFNTTISAGNFEDINDVSLSFNTLLGSPLFQQYKELKSIAGKTYRFAAKVVPYGEAISAVLKVLVDDNEVAEVLEVTKRLEDSVKMIRSEQLTFKGDIIRYHLRSDYYTRVTKPIEQMFELIGTLEAYGLKPNADKLRAFVDGCNIHYRPQAIASASLKKLHQPNTQRFQYLRLISSDCGRPVINATLISGIYDRLQSSRYYHINADNRDEEEPNWVGIHVAAIYSRILLMDEVDRKEAFTKLDRLIESNTLYKESGLHLIRHELLADMGRSESSFDEACLAKNLFIATEYKSSHLLTFASNMLQDYNLTMFLGIVCANVTNPNNREVASYEANLVLEKLERVAVFLSEWIPDMLNSTWTDLEAIIVKKVLNNQANGFNIPRNVQIYNSLRDKVASVLSDVGHPFYIRQFVILPSLETTFWKPRPGTCTSISGHDVHIFLTRSYLDDNYLAHNVDRFNQFIDSNTQVFHTAMLNMRSSLPEYIVEHLNTEYSFDISSLVNNSFYILFSTFSGVRSCPLYYSTYSYSPYNKKMMHELSFYDFDGWAIFTSRCVIHKLILIV